MRTTEELIDSIDFGMLREQRNDLLTDNPSRSTLDGVVNLLDALLDIAYERSQHKE